MPLLKKIAGLFLPIKAVFVAQKFYKTVKLISKILNMEKGVLTKKDEKWLAKFLDACIKLNGIWELIDGPGFRTMIAIADNYAVEKYVAKAGKNFVKEVIELAKARDRDGVAVLIAEKAEIDDGIVMSMGSQAVSFILAAVYEFVESIDIEAEDVE